MTVIQPFRIGGSAFLPNKSILIELVRETILAGRLTRLYFATVVTVDIEISKL